MALALAQVGSFAATLVNNDPDNRFLLLSPTVGAVVSNDAGGFYCSHVLFAATTAAAQPGTSILKGTHGQPLSGFLHVPAGLESHLMRPAVNGERSAQLRTMVGLSLRGFALEAAQVNPSVPVKILVTGFEPFGGAVVNPTGSFVSSVADLDAAMAGAFRVAGPGERLESTARNVLRMRYTLLEGPKLPQTVEVEMSKLEVADSAIDGGERSLQRRITDFQPHAVLSMGVMERTNFVVELSADDFGIRDRGAGFVRDWRNESVSRRIETSALYYGLLRGLTEPAEPAVPQSAAEPRV